MRNEYIVAKIGTTVSTDTIFTYFFVAVLQSSYLRLLLCYCFAVLHLAFTSDPARFASVLRMSLVPPLGAMPGLGMKKEGVTNIT